MGTPGTEPLPTDAAAGLIRAVESADSAVALLGASAALARHLSSGAAPSPEAVLALVQVVGFNNPGAAVAAVDGLIACGEAAVAPLLAHLDAHNYGARAWAVRALAGIGDVRGLELLEQALSADIGPSVRRAAARGLGQLRCPALSAEERRPIRQRALTALEAAGEDGEWVVRYAVVVGLESLGLALAGEAGEDGPLPDGRAPLDRARRALLLRSTAAELTPVVQLRAVRALALLPDPAEP